MLSRMGSHTARVREVVAGQRLPRRTIGLYSVGSVGTGGFGTLPGLVLVYYLTDSLGVSALLAGLVVIVAKVWDVLIDPVIGELSDASAHKTGSRALFMRIGAVALPVFFVLTFAVPHSLEPNVGALWVLVAFITSATAFSLFQVPYIALPAELTQDYDERTRLLTWRVVVLSLAILVFGGGGPALRDIAGTNEQLGYLIMALVAGLAMAVGFYISSLCAPQSTSSAGRSTSNAPQNSLTPASDSARTSVWTRAGQSYKAGAKLLAHNKAFRSLFFTFVAQALATGMMLAAAQYVATWVMADRSAITFLFVALIAPALLCAPLWGKIAVRTGKERAFAAASVLFMVGCITLYVLFISGAEAAHHWPIYLCVALCGAAYAGMQSLPMAMLPDVISHSNGQTSQPVADPNEPDAEPRTSISAEQHGAGIFGGVWTAGETTGMALGSTVLTVVLAMTGYVESVGSQVPVQPEQAKDGIVVAFCLIPAVCIALSLVFLKSYPLRPTHFRKNLHTGK